ncbi:MAG: hypothetical protein A2283_16275 [Lentisphaerae bacterium RIFOXYA12_FULL_48_11]|nr:MAG: hypothetical protein A2283_16275 [Lentisphaerae bacterium RIFOXYA12_FULL_48_11]
MRALVILNSHAGDNETQVLRDMLRHHFSAVRIEYEIHEVSRGDRLVEIVERRLRDGVDLVVVAGGDGTVSEVSNCLAGRSTPLGIIPTGTGNLIARELNIPEETEAAIALIANAPRTRKIDVMRIGKRVYILNASIGISASVIGGTTRKNKNRFGRIAYIGTAILEVLLSRPQHLVVEVDGKAHSYRAAEVAIMNCGLLGRMLYPRGPDIRIDDGYLGVWILSIKTVWDYARYLIGVIAGWAANPEAHFIKVKKIVSIRSNVPLLVQADGDIIGTTPVDVEILPGMLNVLVSEKPVPAQEYKAA